MYMIQNAFIRIRMQSCHHNRCEMPAIGVFVMNTYAVILAI
jgi:hypothetical protein